MQVLHQFVWYLVLMIDPSRKNPITGTINAAPRVCQKTLPTIRTPFTFLLIHHTLHSERRTHCPLQKKFIFEPRKRHSTLPHLFVC